MLPLDLAFRDETGEAVTLGQYFGSRPVLLSLVYYECPMLCSMALNGLVSSLRVLDLEPGRDFDIVTVSFNPREGPELAAAKKATYLAEYDRPQAAAAWHFLTGDSLAIRELTDTVGFRYTWDGKSKQYAHASGLIVTTPSGQLARYFFGIEYSPRDMRLGLVEASAGKLGNVVDQALLYCFRYDPESGTYAAAALNLVRAGGAVTVVVMNEVIDIFEGITGGWTQGRAERLLSDMRKRGLNASAYEIVECGDENTGRRFGAAKVRRGWAVKLGSGGRNKGSRYAYQVWAVVKPEYRREGL